MYSRLQCWYLDGQRSSRKKRPKPKRADAKHIVHENTYRSMDGTELREMFAYQCGASPMVQKQISLPLLLRLVKSFSSSVLRNNLEANAKPSALGIWLAVGAISLLVFF